MSPSTHTEVSADRETGLTDPATGTAPEPGPAPAPDADSPASSLVSAAPKVQIRTVFRRFWPDTRPFRGRMLLSLAITAGVPALSTVSIWLFGVLVDDVLTPADYRLFPAIAAAYLGITLATGAVTFADEYLSAWVTERFVLGLRVRLFDHLGNLSIGFFEKRPLGDILSRLTGDVAAIEQMVLSGVNMVLTYFFQIAFYATAMLFLNWQLTLIAFVAAPAFLLLTRFLSRRIADAAREQRRRSGSISSVAEESLANAALVQAYDRSAAETERFRTENEASFRAQMRATRLEGLFGPVSSLVQAVGVLLVIGFAVRELAAGRLSLGGLLVFVTYLTQLYGPVSGFGELANSLFAAGAGAERIIEVLDTRPGVPEPAEPRPLGRARGEIAVEGVDFGYPGAGRPAVQELSFRIPSGGRVAIVGASGAGKTTVSKLLLRFYDPDRGRITLDGRDVRELPLADLRANVTAVLQDTLVFDGTVEDNIRWARPDATDEQVVAAARAADVHDFVSALPEGYRTRIGQRGRLLSGGQRQRLAIARAMIRDAPVLVLDEPTTGLDAEATERVLAPLRRLMATRTTIVISHNLRTVTDADQILYLEHGRLVAAGPHEDLLARSPGYHRLFALHRTGPRPHPDDTARDGATWDDAAEETVEPDTTRLPATGYARPVTVPAGSDADGPGPETPDPEAPGAQRPGIDGPDDGSPPDPADATPDTVRLPAAADTVRLPVVGGRARRRPVPREEFRPERPTAEPERHRRRRGADRARPAVVTAYQLATHAFSAPAGPGGTRLPVPWPRTRIPLPSAELVSPSGRHRRPANDRSTPAPDRPRPVPVPRSGDDAGPAGGGRD